MGIVTIHIQKNVSRSKKFGNNPMKQIAGKTIAIRYFQSLIEILNDFILKQFSF